ncbi:MAG TPA: class I tRNA ligase family protein, partial [Chlamydiales bacterium]|nr:class I tRNA ligase family protein [Chlamydiales bacterium]
VGNPWLDAGIVPFSTMGYLQDKRYWKKWFPAEVVSESFPGQFKNWFYSLLVMSAVLENTAPVKTIFGYASVKDEKGEEMHKSKGNAIWFDEAVEKIGADPMRFMYMRQNPADNMLFGYKFAEEIKRKLLVLQNVYTFFTTYVKKEEFPVGAKIKAKNILDKWIISKLEHVISAAEFSLDKFDVAKAVLAMEDFCMNDLSLWYVRRSRKRFHETSPERSEAIAVLYYVLITVAKVFAPVMPFFAEQMYQDLRTPEMPESVHLCDWPKTSSNTDLDLEQNMDHVRAVVAAALAERNAKAVKIRQPLAKLKVKNLKLKALTPELLELIKDEVNVKEVVFSDTIEKEVELDTALTQELKEEGMLREIVRDVQAKRK